MKYLKVVWFILLVELMGSIGTFFTSPKIQTWYATLNKPSFSPPNWVFGPVWGGLFFLMGLALYLVWETGPSRARKMAVWAFSVQMALNVLWSAFFFGKESPFLGLVDIALLLLTIVWTIFSFKKVNRTAAWLLLPYLLWVSFATILNFAIWRLN